MNNYNNIWKEMVQDYNFFDLYESNGGELQENYDIILPLKNSTPLFKENLFSWYRNININRILVGDADSGDDSIDIIKNFPRVKIFDHKKLLTSGYSIKKLIEEVETRYFFHFHCDVFIKSSYVHVFMCNYCFVSGKSCLALSLYFFYIKAFVLIGSCHKKKPLLT